jgi:L-alanine-DL-glutamate epimerase-like enolase superfamily enzyme
VSSTERTEVFVASPARNSVTLRITTSDEVTGLGDATLNRSGAGSGRLTSGPRRAHGEKAASRFPYDPRYVPDRRLGARLVRRAVRTAGTSQAP